MRFYTGWVRSVTLGAGAMARSSPVIDHDSDMPGGMGHERTLAAEFTHPIAAPVPRACDHS